MLKALSSGQNLVRFNQILPKRSYSHYSNESKSDVQPRIKYDMRSDTVTKPTSDMFQQMVSAEIGDDVYGEDKSVLALEKRMADMCGKEAGLFCTSGTLSNQLGIRTHLSSPPHSVLCDVNAHVNVYEAGGIAFHSRAATVTIQPKNQKYITLQEVKEKYIPDLDDVHDAPTRLICLENTINGVVMPLPEIREISDFARENNIKIHLDGARLWNASVQAGFSFEEIGRNFDSVSVCFSKGLGAPVGSILLGDAKFIRKARHFRKLFGGGWRQAGILAEAVQYCIDNHLKLLKEDHRRAKKLASELQKLGIRFDHPVETNMVFADFTSVKLDAIKASKAIEDAGILIMPYSNSVGRIVFHHQVGEDAIETIVKSIKSLM